MEHNINYRGQVITITVNEEVCSFSYLKGGNIYAVAVYIPVPVRFTQSIGIDYAVNVIDQSGETLKTYRGKEIVLGKPYYDHYYNLTPSISSGQHGDRGGVNMSISQELGEPAFPFNTDNEFAPIQPVIFDISNADDTITIGIVDEPENGVCEYSVDGGATFQSENIFPLLTIGTYEIWVKNSIDNFPFKKSYVLAYEA